MGASVSSPTTLMVEPRSSVRAAPDRSAGVGSSHGQHGSDHGWVWYFAYGSNMNPNTLSGRRQVFPLESQAGMLQDWTLSFRMLGLPYAEPGFATIERATTTTTAAAALPSDPAAAPASPSAPAPAAGPPSPRSPSPAPAPAPSAPASALRWRSEVHGVLHRISAGDWVRVMATEGVGAGKTGYRVVEVEVEAYDGRVVRALTLEGQAPSLHSLGRSVAPSARYIGLLREGARIHGLDPSYISYLDSLLPYNRTDWASALGRVAALAAILPLALPLLPPVLLTRMARERATKAAGGDGGGGGGGGGGDGVGAAMAAAAAASTVATDLSSRVAAAAGGGVEPSPAEAEAVAAAAASPSFAPVVPGRTVSVVAAAGGAGGALVPLPVPPELMRPPRVLPEAVAIYMTAVQWTAWGLHDYLMAPLLGSGSSGGGRR